ncbi:hypothetical protein ACFYNV_29075 [Streptomyces albidoflavus]
MASRTRDFFRSLKPGDDHALADQLRASAQERQRQADADKARKREQETEARMRRHKRGLPRLG